MSGTYYVYILASKPNGTLYIGVTNNLEKRTYEHKNHLVKGFTEKYNVNILVYFEETNDIQEAIKREKQLKKWNRKWKLELIEKVNPHWNDLSKDWSPGSPLEFIPMKIGDEDDITRVIPAFLVIPVKTGIYINDSLDPRFDRG